MKLLKSLGVTLAAQAYGFEDPQTDDFGEEGPLNDDLLLMGLIRHPFEELPFDENAQILIKSNEVFKRTLDLTSEEVFYWKFDVPCAEAHRLKVCIQDNEGFEDIAFADAGFSYNTEGLDELFYGETDATSAALDIFLADFDSLTDEEIAKLLREPCFEETNPGSWLTFSFKGLKNSLPPIFGPQRGGAPTMPSITFEVEPVIMKSCNPAPPSELESVCLPLIDGSKRSDASIKYYTDATIQTRVSELSLESSSNGNPSREECLKECALTAGCFKVNYRAGSSCSLRGNELEKIDDVTFAITGEGCGGSDFIWQDSLLSWEFLFEFSNVADGEELVKFLERENSELSEWEVAVGDGLRTSEKFFVEVAEPPKKNPITGLDVDPNNTWLKFTLRSYTRFYTNTELLKDNEDGSERNGWFGRRRRGTDMDSIKQSNGEKIDTFQENVETGDAKVETKTEPKITQASKSDEPAAASCQSGFELQSDNTCGDIDECASSTPKCGKLEVCENTVGAFICKRKPIENYPFDEENSRLIIDEAELKYIILNPADSPVHLKIDVPCAKAYNVRLYSGENNAYGSDDDTTRFGLNWEGKPEDLIVEETEESEDDNGSKSGALEDLLLNQEILASWMTLSFAGYEETPASESDFPIIRLVVEPVIDENCSVDDFDLMLLPLFKDPFDSLPFDENKKIEINSQDVFKTSLELTNPETFHYKFDVPCAEKYSLKICINDHEGHKLKDFDNVGLSFNFEGLDQLGDIMSFELTDYDTLTDEDLAFLRQPCLEETFDSSWLTVSFEGLNSNIPEPFAELGPKIGDGLVSPSISLEVKPVPMTAACNPAPASEFDSVCLPLIDGSKRSDASIKYYTDATIQTRVSELSLESSSNGKDSREECLKECALTAGCFKIYYRAGNTCSLRGNELDTIDDVTFAITGEECDGTDFIWQDSLLEMEFFCKFSSVDQGEGFIKSLEEENPEFFEWDVAVYGDVRTTEKFFVELLEPNEYPETGVVNPNNIWVKFRISSYSRWYTNTELLEETQEIEMPESQRNGWFGRRRRATDFDAIQKSAEASIKKLQENLDIGDAQLEKTTEAKVTKALKSDEPAAASCQSGFELQSDNTCADIDECASSTPKCGKLEDCENTHGSFLCKRKVTTVEDYPFEEENSKLYTDEALFELILDPMNKNGVHWKLDVPCAEGYIVRINTAQNNNYGSDDDKTRFSLGWEGKPENLKIEETGDSEDKSGSKTGTFDELLRFQDISASWMTLSFAGFEETPAAGLSFPKIKVSIKTDLKENCSAKPASSFPSSCLSMLPGNKRTDASVKYYKDSNIETSLSHLSTSSVAGKESITDCLKQCALTAGCLKAKYGLDSCELKGSDLAHVDGKSFAIKAEQCSGTGYIWQDKNIEFEQIIEYQVPSGTSAATLVKTLKAQNPNFSDWQFGENGVTERNSYRITFEEMPPPSVHPDSSKTLTTGNLWLKFEIDFYIREYTNDELTTEIPLNKSKRTGWWTSNRWRRQSSGGASTTAQSVSAELASSTANMNLPAGTTAQPIDPSQSLSSKSPPASTPSCQSGYNLQTDGTCADIDECSKGTDNCSESETCKNTDGSFKCEEKLLQKLIRFMMIQQLMTAMQQQEQPIIQVQSPPVSFWSPPKNSQ